MNRVRRRLATRPAGTTSSAGATGATGSADRRDVGATLTEVVVALSIMAVFMTIFTTGMVSMLDAANKTESMNTAQTQLNIAFIRLDREVRYASGISTAGKYGSDWYVEFVSTDPDGVQAQCTQLRLNGALQRLERRTWLRSSGMTSAKPWSTLASGVTSDEPFKAMRADATSSFQRLQVRLTAKVGITASSTTTNSDVTFSALNTSRNATEEEDEDDETVCAEGRPT